MRASMRADGTTFRLRCTSGSVETEDLDGREELTGVPHIDEVDVGDIANSATRGYENHLCIPLLAGLESLLCCVFLGELSGLLPSQKRGGGVKRSPR